MKAELINYMGSDLTVVNAARVSFDKESDWELEEYGAFEDDPCGWVERVLSDKDKKLINYLAKHNHFTPFTHCMITLRETVPIFVARQRFKHMVGFTYNEVSRRYVDDTPEFYIPDAWRSRPDGSMKQGSSDETINFVEGSLTFYPFAHETENSHMVKMGYRKAGKYSLKKDYKIFLDVVENLYKHMINSGVAPEQARMVLPQSMYTSYYVTGSLAAFARAYNLRSQPDAQKEIQDLAAQWNEILEPLYPESWKALTQ